MSAETEFTRLVRTWLHEDAPEDPGRVLAQVAEVVAREPQGRPTGPLSTLRTSTRSVAAVLAAAAVIVVVIGGLVLIGPSVGPQPSPTVSPSPSPAATGSPGPTFDPSFDPSAPGVANDAPCSRTLPAGSLAPAPMPFHHEDLERMVLTREDVGGLAGFEPDVSAQGFHDNVEVTSLGPNPSTTCDDIRRLGRLEGYGNVFTNFNDGRQVQFDVHVFWKDEDAASWIETFTAGLAAEVAATGGEVRFEQAPLDVELADATLWIHTGGDGIRTWVFLQRGPIVGWIVDLHPDEATTIDVPAAAVLMADRIESVEAELAALAPRPLNVAQLLSAPLPKAAYGDIAAQLQWDWFLGGCQDTAERGFIAGDEAREDAIRFGRISGCTAMYSLPGTSGDVVRVFSSVNVHADADNASGALEANVASMEAVGGVRFAAAGVGDEAIGIATPAQPGESGGPADTRVVLRIGSLMAFVSIQGPAAPDSQSYILDLGRQLDARIRAVLAAG